MKSSVRRGTKGRRRARNNKSMGDGAVEALRGRGVEGRASFGKGIGWRKGFKPRSPIPCDACVGYTGMETPKSMSRSGIFSMPFQSTAVSGGSPVAALHIVIANLRSEGQQQVLECLGWKHDFMILSRNKRYLSLQNIVQFYAVYQGVLLQSTFLFRDCFTFHSMKLREYFYHTSDRLIICF